MKHLMPSERIEHKILVIRNEKVMIDSDLAELYGVTTKVLNQAVKRNIDRFPKDFMFRLNTQEKEDVVTNCDHLQRLKFASTLPYVFTEHGAIMLASVLNSPIAIQTSIQIVRVFIQLREIAVSHKELAQKLKRLEKKYDSQFKMVFDAIRELMKPPSEKQKKQIGFSHRSEG